MTSVFAQRVTIFMALLLGLVLSVIPMSSGLSAWRPEWALMILLYWVLALPHRLNIGSCFVVGIAMDILMGSTLGIHAAAYALVGYVVARHYQRVRNFSLSQQAFFILVLAVVERSVVYLIEYYLNNAALQLHYFLPAISTAIMWPWLFLLLRKYRRRFGVV
ncbi:rod shape-determining protein MreD [Aliidiomarina minuta]|uniref:Rod shape-determining protein MreD n=1 Tax=Aliidiomarina minuta TaxID=880057 RepID=A0A432W995_9GAMM|nr:rod shape-determining protein MreD [Aliidiomarina minuta]RUO26669.1 rod shape-determining protein MreD [Aliidiomarina minuta]